MIKYRDIVFGQASAELESAYHPELLLNGFLDPWDIVNESVSGPKCLFLGYKGSGKSSIGEHLRLVADQQSKLFVNHVFLSDFPYGNFNKIVTGDSAPESRFPSAWTWILVLYMLESFEQDHGSHSSNDDQFVRTVNALNEIGMLPGKDLNRTILASSKLKYKLQLPALLGLEWDSNRKKVDDLEFLHIVDKLKEVALNFKSDSKHILVIDGLDDILLQDDIQYKSIAALIYELARLNTLFARSKVPAKVIVLCRTELFERLPGANKNKIRQDLSIELDWYHNPKTPESSNLVHLVNNRAMMSDSEIKGVFSQYFPQTMKNQPVLFFLLQHTRHTPRDFIQILKYIQTCSRKNEPSPQEVFAGLRNYSSKYFLPEIKDELVGYLKVEEIDVVFRALARVDPKHFSFEEFSSTLKGTKLINQRTLTEVVEMLFQCSAIGNVAGKAGSRHYSFKFRNRHANASFDQNFAVHKGLWDALRLWTSAK